MPSVVKNMQIKRIVCIGKIKMMKMYMFEYVLLK